MELKNLITSAIKLSGLSNKEVVALLDEIRKDYHDRKNVGDKNVSKKELSKMQALIQGSLYPVSTKRSYIFYKGDWRKVKNNAITYLGAQIEFKLKRTNK